MRHVLPNALCPLVGYATSCAGLVIGVEATLTFVGVGLQLPALFLVLAAGSLVLVGRASSRAADPLS